MRPSLKGTMPEFLPPIVVDRTVAAARSVGWRTGGGDDLRRRRGIVARYALANLTMGMATLYQSGLVAKLPDLPLPRFDAQHVESSAEGYQVLGVPDSVLAVFNNGLTMVLATLGGPGSRSRALRTLTALKVTVDSAYVTKLLFDQAVHHKRYCWQCMVAAGATVSALPAAWKQARQGADPSKRRISRAGA